MITKNGGKLSKSYFVSYLNLVMNARACSVDEAHAFAFKELFHNDQETYGMATYKEFKKAYIELKGAGEEQLNED
ncbi:hypothetical protein [Guptibacillus algicola]|uniref:hypothetical protein n=1 Tax=Guptibacillus algicola TaxID=225844 RepID=UPI001CD27C14|nr:hypothetical protein [Alkalihalobacillus algicola]MCA0987568.1 hypothetical protein [Alkalihalobacillus algicola]